ncbi:MAG: hypothetical protein ASARMPREDX12_008821 [Alectoria sarmentosa]|nr:MAG: hypothetical protein ASARMPREDX12_008821 [Alectoria sarmentosa]
MSLPIKLESIYDTILQRIQRQESHNRHLAISLLCWVLFAKRPLTSSELRHALAIDEGQTQLASQLVLDPSWFAKISGGLVQVDPNTSVVRFLHVSVRDYLTSRSTDWIANIETEALELRFQSYPLLEYAAHFQYLHVQQETENLVKDQMGYGRDFPAYVTDLHVAAALGLKNTVAHLLGQKDHDINARDNYGNTPLQAAILNKNEFIARMLIDRGADAARAGDSQTIDLLLNNGANIELRDRRFDRIALRQVASSGHQFAVALLLEKGANTDAKSKDGAAPLRSAVMNGHASIVAALLRYSATSSSCIEDLHGLLQAATDVGNKTILRSLVEAAALNSSNGPPLLDWSSTEGRLTLTRILVEDYIQVVGQGKFKWILDLREAGFTIEEVLRHLR